MSGHMGAEGVVSTIPERCRRCYTCVRECPAQAIRVVGGQATVIEERCIACGNCVKVCAQRAKRVNNAVPDVEEMLRGAAPVFACLAPSFPAAFHPIAPGKIISAVRGLGFSEVWEVAIGAELVAREYGRYLSEARKKGLHVIATPCPALVTYVEKHMPSLVTSLAPIVSPMIATARAIRCRHGQGVRIVFIGPCIAKKNECKDSNVAGEVDTVITFEGLDRMFAAAGIDVEGKRESFFDSPRCHLGRAFPISGGLLKAAGIRWDILENDTVVTEGKDRVFAALHEVAAGRSEARLFDILLCDGCINGPMMPTSVPGFVRKEKVANFVTEQSRRTTEREVIEALAEFSELDLRRRFSRIDVNVRMPSETEIRQALRTMKKESPDDHLNCGACGYPTCRDKAIAVCRGLAEPEMCLPYLIEELEATCFQLRVSNEELAQAQRRLVQTECLASMGQLSAGVAHEINNPLGVILIYSSLLLDALKDDDSRKQEAEVVVREASRCRDIVRGLLDFARQSRVSKTPTDLEQLIQEVAAIMEPRLTDTCIQLETEVAPDLPVLMIDALQIKQLIVNLVQNGVDAILTEGRVSIRARLLTGGDLIEIVVSDTGCGIPEENLSKLFTPFFTTKEQGKGTGLGLAIAYGVVKMHCGDICADSTLGRGTTFTVTLPVEQEVPEDGSLR